MANEWTSRDVLIVMRRKSDANGLVSLADVKSSFKLNSAVAQKQFDDFVDHLIVGGDYIPTSGMWGIVRYPELEK